MRVNRVKRGAIGVFLLVALPLFAVDAVSAGQAKMGDPELIGLVADEYQNVDEFLSALVALEMELLEREDARAVFAATYRVLTTHAIDDLGEGVFEDEEWAVALTLAFGNLYRQAFLDYETGNFVALPRAWWVAFDAAERESVTVFQHALLGINAHVNRDLAYAIAAVTPRNERDQRLADYLRTNDLVIGAILDAEYVLGNIAPPLAALDEALGDFDAELLRVVLTQWRFRAWRNAQLFDGTLPPFYESVMVWFLDLQTGYLARVIATGGR